MGFIVILINNPNLIVCNHILKQDEAKILKKVYNTLYPQNTYKILEVKN